MEREESSGATKVFEVRKGVDTEEVGKRIGRVMYDLSCVKGLGASDLHAIAHYFFNLGINAADFWNGYTDCSAEHSEELAERDDETFPE